MRYIKKFTPYLPILLLFAVFELGMYWFISDFKEKKVTEYLQDTSKAFQSDYQLVIDSYRDKANIVYDTLIDTYTVKSHFKAALKASGEMRNTLRDELHDMLFYEYQKLQNYGFKQVHFHTPDNHSFLRMHAPKLYGDDLQSFRKTVTYVNQTHERISGFEEGVAYNGYRFVFPLFDETDYLGSVELSFSSYSISKNFKNTFLETNFIIAKDAIIKKGHGSMHNHYVTSALDPHFVIDNRFENNANVQFNDLFEILHQAQKSKNHPKTTSITLLKEGQRYIETFIPVQNPVTLETSAYLVILSDGKYISHMIFNYTMAFLTLSLLVLLLIARYYRNRHFRLKLAENHKELASSHRRLKTIIDNQDNMIVITDGTHMIEVNAKVLEYFGKTSFEQLKEEHTCICETFLPYKDRFYTDILPEASAWVGYLQSIPPKRRIVTMKNIHGDENSFQVKINKYGEDGSSIITFTDITDLLSEQTELKYQAQHDKLTDIFNRQKIDSVIASICSSQDQRKTSIGIAIFDIDHFKKINDLYGHDTGDEVLKSVASLIKRNLRKEDIFGRWGGEEFLIIFKDMTLTEVESKAESLRQALENHKDHRFPSITASFGLTMLKSDDTPKTLLKRADVALYEAKSKGRNSLVVYTHEHVLSIA